MGWITTAEAQGTMTVTFDDWPPYSFSQYYTESGVLLQVLSTNGNPPQSVMGRYPGGPVDPTPFMDWVEDHGTNSGYVSISLLSGQPFGLASVDIGQISSARTLQFIGYPVSGGTVSTTYNFPPSGMQTFAFGPEFSQGLTHVDLFALSYAMDNLVVTVPEPHAGALLLLSMLGLASRCRTGRRGLTNKDSIDRSARAQGVSLEVRRSRARGASMLSGVERARPTRLVFCF
jgi:hypothetical protein